MKSTLFALIAGLMLLTGVPSAQAEGGHGGHGAYPENQVLRPLTLPAGRAIVGVLAIYEQTDQPLDAEHGDPAHATDGDGDGDSEGEFHGGVEARYGVTDSFEVNWLGIKFAALRDPGVFDLAIVGGLKDFGDGDHTGASTVTFAGLEAKWIANDSFALRIKALGYSGSYENDESVSDALFSVGPMFAINEHVAVELTGEYHVYDGYETDGGAGYGGKIYINGYGHHSLEFVLAAKMTDYPPLTIDRHVHENQTLELEFVVAWLF